MQLWCKKKHDKENKNQFLLKEKSLRRKQEIRYDKKPHYGPVLLMVHMM